MLCLDHQTWNSDYSKAGTINQSFVFGIHTWMCTNVFEEKKEKKSENMTTYNKILNMFSEPELFNHFMKIKFSDAIELYSEKNLNWDGLRCSNVRCWFDFLMSRLVFNSKRGSFSLDEWLEVVRFNNPFFSTAKLRSNTRLFRVWAWKSSSCNSYKYNSNFQVIIVLITIYTELQQTNYQLHMIFLILMTK